MGGRALLISRPVPLTGEQVLESRGSDWPGAWVRRSPGLSNVLELIVQWLIESELNGFALHPLFSGSYPELHFIFGKRAYRPNWG